MGIKTKTTIRVADGLVKRHRKIFHDIQEQQTWYNEIRQLHGGTNRNHHLLGVVDLDYKFAKRKVDPVNPNRGYWLWKGVYEDKYGSIGSRALAGKHAKELQKELNLAFASQQAKDKVIFDNKINAFFNKQFRLVDSGSGSDAQKAAMKDRLGQQLNIMVNKKIHSAAPSQVGRTIVANPFITFFESLGQRYLVDSLITEEKHLYWAGEVQVTSNNVPLTYGGDFGSQCYTPTGLYDEPMVPAKRLQLYFVSASSNSPCVSNIFLTERLLMKRYGRGGARVNNPWRGPDALCSYGHVVGILAYCHLTWNEASYCFDE